MSGCEFWIDVGGTFTDSFARRDDGTLVHYKVLSSGVIKGAVAAGSTASSIVDPARAADPAEIWSGFRLRLLDARRAVGGACREAVFARDRQSRTE